MWPGELAAALSGGTGKHSALFPVQRAIDNEPDHRLAEQCSKLHRRAEDAEASLRQERHRRQRADRERALALARADEARVVALAHAAGPGAAALAEPLQGLAEPLRTLASQLPALLAAVPRGRPAREPTDSMQTCNVEARCPPALLPWRSPTAHWQRPSFSLLCDMHAMKSLQKLYTLAAGSAGGCPCPSSPPGLAT